MTTMCHQQKKQKETINSVASPINIESPQHKIDIASPINIEIPQHTIDIVSPVNFESPQHTIDNIASPNSSCFISDDSIHLESNVRSPKAQRGRRRQRDSSKWACNISKRKRNFGEEYISRHSKKVM